MKPSILFEKLVTILEGVDINTSSTHSLDATVAFLATVAMKISESKVVEKYVRLNVLEYVLWWIDSAMVKINANFSTAVAKAKSTERKNFVNSYLHSHTEYC